MDAKAKKEIRQILENLLEEPDQSLDLTVSEIEDSFNSFRRRAAEYSRQRREIEAKLCAEKTVLYVSEDSGTIYQEYAVDLKAKSNDFQKIEVPNTFQLTAEQVCGCHGQISEILLRTNIAKKVD